jgi:arylsulfatase A-like enzyme
MAENIDLAGTFAGIGGARFAGDGRSLLPLLQGQPATEWRNAVLIEHRGRPLRSIDPDFQQAASGNPNSYEAMRTQDFLYVEYTDGETEFYDLTRDPLELHNLAGRLTLGQQLRLHQELSALRQCRGTTQCGEAMRIDAPVVSVGRRHR